VTMGWLLKGRTPMPAPSPSKLVTKMAATITHVAYDANPSGDCNPKRVMGVC